MIFRSINDMNTLLRNGLNLIPRDIDLIAGIPRSGMLPATLLAVYLNLPLTDIMSLLSDDCHDISSRSLRFNGKNSTNINDYKKVLVIDDSCSTGKSINEVKNSISAIPDLKTEFVYACVFATSNAISYVDIFFEIVDQPRFFEWNILNHPMLEYTCMDMDGVLCYDPTDEQNDDGEKYVDFLLSAEPKWIPKFRIGAIVTSRLEKYRSHTEQWLREHGVKYTKLIMLDLPSKKERIRLGAHSLFKADIYSKAEDTILFIESDPKQAQDISSATGKAVYCVSDNQFYNECMNVDKYISIKTLFDEYFFKTSGIVGKLLSLYDHISDVTIRVSIINALILGWNTIIASMYEVFSEASCSAMHDSIEDIKNVFENGDYEVCCEKLIELYHKYEDITLHERKIQILKAANSISAMEWDRELKRIQKILTKDLLQSDALLDAFKTEILYLRKINALQMYPYEWTEEYDINDVEVYTQDSGLKYVLHGGRPLYFKSHDNDIVKYEYNQLILEQDKRSPHRYFDDICNFKEGDIFIDVGAAEGMISLDVIKLASRVILIECDNEWIQSLNMTFKDHMSKVEIVRKFAGDEDTDDSITLDSLMSGQKEKRIFIKIDVEGMEMEVLMGARTLLSNNDCNVSCAVYHMQEQEQEVKAFFDEIGYKSYNSDGYVLFLYGYQVLKNGKYERIQSPYFRRALVRATARDDGKST